MTAEFFLNFEVVSDVGGQGENCIVISMFAETLMHFLLFLMHMSIRCWYNEFSVVASCEL